MNYRVAYTIILLLAAGERAGAQRPVGLSGHVIVSRVHETVMLAGSTVRSAGTWFGASVAGTRGRFTLSATGLHGGLHPIESGEINRTGGEIEARARFQARRWIALDAGYLARAFSGAAGYQRWNTFAIGANLSTTLGDPMLRTEARIAYVPWVNVTLPEHPGLALDADLRVIMVPRHTPLTASLTYRFQRYDFEGGSTGRLEAFDGLGIAIGYRMK